MRCLLILLPLFAAAAAFPNGGLSAQTANNANNNPDPLYGYGNPMIIPAAGGLSRQTGGSNNQAQNAPDDNAAANAAANAAGGYSTNTNSNNGVIVHTETGAALGGAGGQSNQNAAGAGLGGPGGASNNGAGGAANYDPLGGQAVEGYNGNSGPAYAGAPGGTSTGGTANEALLLNQALTSKSMSAGAAAGIAIGVIAVAALGTAVGVILLRR